MTGRVRVDLHLRSLSIPTVRKTPAIFWPFKLYWYVITTPVKIAVEIIKWLGSYLALRMDVMWARCGIGLDLIRSWDADKDKRYWGRTWQLRARVYFLLVRLTIFWVPSIEKLPA